MARGFAGGLVWGILFAGGGLAALSLLTPQPGPDRTPLIASDAAGVVAGPEAGASVVGVTATGETEQAPGAAADQAANSAGEIAAAPSARPVVETGEGGGGLDTAPQPAGPLTPEALMPGQALPDLPGPLPALTEAAPALSALDDALTALLPDPGPMTAAAPAPEPLGAKDALLVPSQGVGLTEPSRLPQIAALEEPELIPAVVPQAPLPLAPRDPVPKAAAPLAPRVIVPDSPTLPPAGTIESTRPTTLKPTVPGVATNSLPQVGDPPSTDSAAGSISNAAAVPEADLPPLVRYARSFARTGTKPLFAILLHDVGGAGMSRDDLARLPFPVSFVIDPLATDAKAAETAYRAAGQEVLMLANGIPPGATAGDLAQTFQTLADTLPQAVAVIDRQAAGFQNNRALAALVLPVIADQGRGLVTYDEGLNAADQIARRDGLPAAVVFRRLDGAGESQPTIRRYLDRAAFKAAQEGAVMVLGDTSADTVAAILQWAIEGKGASVDLAPVTAVLGAR